MSNTRKSEAGFTLLEMTAAIAIVGSLAAVALPSLGGTTRKAKRDAEVNAFFGELRLREAAYLGEQGRYLSTGSSEADSFPAAPTASDQELAERPASWSQLRIQLPELSAQCTYVAIAGGPSDNAGSIATSQFGFKKPASRSWYYLLAHCLDGDDDKYYFASDDDGTVRSTGDVNPISHEGEGTTAQAGTAPSTGTTGAGTGTTGSDSGNTGNTNAGAGTGTTGSDASSTGTTTTTPTGNGPGNGNGNTGVHANSGGGNGTECVNGVEVDPGNSGNHNNSPEGSSCTDSTTTGGNGHGHGNH